MCQGFGHQQESDHTCAKASETNQYNSVGIHMAVKQCQVCGCQVGGDLPAMPMARPTSDSLSAGASLVPSPVTATISPRFFSSFTSTYLSCGELRASTCAYAVDPLSSQTGLPKAASLFQSARFPAEGRKKSTKTP